MLSSGKFGYPVENRDLRVLEPFPSRATKRRSPSNPHRLSRPLLFEPLPNAIHIRYRIQPNQSVLPNIVVPRLELLERGFLIPIERDERFHRVNVAFIVQIINLDETGLTESEPRNPHGPLRVQNHRYAFGTSLGEAEHEGLAIAQRVGLIEKQADMFPLP